MAAILARPRVNGKTCDYGNAGDRAIRSSEHLHYLLSHPDDLQVFVHVIQLPY